MDGLGTELGIGSGLLIIGKIVADIIREWRAKKQAVKVVEANGNAGNPVKRSGTSSNLTLHLLDEHGRKLEEHTQDFKSINKGLGRIDVRLTKIETKMEIQ